MFTETHYPIILEKAKLDDYLAKGWYRMGQSIFTTHFLVSTGTINPTIWIRLKLDGHVFKKSHRKLMRKVERDFKVVVRAYILDEEKQRMYEKHCENFPTSLPNSLKDSLLSGEDYSIYDTHEVAIYDGDELIACSFFDMGEKAAQSIMSPFDPKYNKYSLGIYTLLKEIEYCMEQGLDYYYPGYVVPGNERFNYKLRIGDVEFFDIKDQIWRANDDYHYHLMPNYLLIELMFELMRTLDKKGMTSRLISFYAKPEHTDQPKFGPIAQPLALVYDKKNTSFIVDYCTGDKIFHIYEIKENNLKLIYKNPKLLTIAEKLFLISK